MGNEEVETERDEEEEEQEEGGHSMDPYCVSVCMTNDLVEVCHPRRLKTLWLAPHRAFVCGPENCCSGDVSQSLASAQRPRMGHKECMLNDSGARALASRQAPAFQAFIGI